MTRSIDKEQLLKEINELKRDNKALIQEKIKREEINANMCQESHLLNTLLDTSEDAIYFKDTESKFTTVNAKMVSKRRLSGKDEMIGKSDFDYFSAEHANQAFQDEQNILKTGKPLVGIVEKETWPDGSINWVSTSKMPIVDDNGRITGIVGISRDITEQKVTENELIASEERFRSLILNLSDMILILDESALIKYASNSSENVLGLPSNQLIDTLATDFIHPDDKAYMQGEFEKVLRKEHDFNPMQLRCRNENKGWVYLDIIGNNLIGLPGIDGIVITARDITERRNAEIEAKKTLLELKRSNLELEQFAYAVSHDLQEPLRKVKSFAELLSHQYGNSLDDKALKYIEFMVDGTHRMQILIRDLLSYSRLINNNEPYSEVDTGLLVQNTLSNLQLAIDESNATIEVQNLPVIFARRKSAFPTLSESSE